MYRTWPLAVLLAVAAGCTNTELERDFDKQMSLGETMFAGGKFDMSVRAYVEATKLKNEHFQAYIALATSASECSMSLYGEAQHLLELKKQEAMMDALKRADEMTDMANRAFTKALRIRPEDPIAHYGFALMLFKRAASPYRFPYPPGNPAALKQRNLELDEAIKQFEVVLGREKVSLDHAEHAKRCSSPQAHRYLGLAFVMRGDWERNDIEKMRAHLAAYLVWVQGARDMIIRRNAGSTDEEKKRRDAELQAMEKEILEVQDLLRTLEKTLTEYEVLFRNGREEPPVPGPKREARAAMLQRELLTLQAMVREFDGVRATPAPPR